MDDLDDELDLRYHRDLNPEVYYRCPNSESLDGALRNELEKNAASVIPMEIVTEFVFSLTSSITISVLQQPKLDSLFEPAAFPQSIAVEHALCRDVEEKERVKLQRAIAKSIIETFQEIDGFKYTERHAGKNHARDGSRFKFVCAASLQNRNRAANSKKGKGKEKESDDEHQYEDDVGKPKGKTGAPILPTYDCGGAVFVKFSTKRETINVIYKHNPIHSTPVVDEAWLPALATDDVPATNDAANGSSSNGTKTRKRKRSKKDHHVEVDTEFDDPDLDMSTSPEATKAPAKKGRKKGVVSLEASRTSSSKKVKKSKLQSPAKSRKKSAVVEPSPPPVQPVKSKCLRCREKGIKCNEAKPTCNQCRRGLWTCQYEVTGSKKRSKNGCINCKTRRRKCTEERPSCAHCLKIDDDCRYQDHA